MKTAKFTHNGIEYEIDIPEPETNGLLWIVLPSDRSPTWLPIRWDVQGQVASVMKVESEKDVLRARQVNPSPVGKKGRLSDYRFMFGGHEYQVDMIQDDRLQAHRVDAPERPPCTCPALRAEGAAPCARHGWVYVPKETAPPTEEQTEISRVRRCLRAAHEEIATLQREMRRANDRHSEDQEALQKACKLAASMTDLYASAKAQLDKAIADRNDETRMLSVSREDVKKLTQDLNQLRGERDRIEAQRSEDAMRLGALVSNHQDKALAAETEISRLKSELEEARAELDRLRAEVVPAPECTCGYNSRGSFARHTCDCPRRDHLESEVKRLRALNDKASLAFGAINTALLVLPSNLRKGDTVVSDVRALADAFKAAESQRDQLRTDITRILASIGASMAPVPARLRAGPSAADDVRRLADEYVSIMAERDRLRTELNRWAPKVELERLRADIAELRKRHDEDQEALGHARDARDELRADIEKLRQEHLDMIAERDALRGETAKLGHQIEIAAANERELQRLRAELESIQSAVKLSRSPTLLAFTKEPPLHEQVMAIVFDGNRALDRNKSDAEAMELQAASNRLVCRERDDARKDFEEERDKRERSVMAMRAVMERHDDWKRNAIATLGVAEDFQRELAATDEQVGLLKHALEEAQKELRTVTSVDPDVRDNLHEIIEGMREKLRAKDAEIRQYQLARGWEPDEVTPEILRASFVAMEEKIRSLSTAVNRADERLRVKGDMYNIAAMERGRYRAALVDITNTLPGSGEAHAIARNALVLSPPEAQSGS